MSASEDESQQLDAGWDDEERSPPSLSSAPSSGEVDEVDEAWDSVPSPVSAAAPSVPPQTEEVDVGWDDVAPQASPQGAGGKRRPHRQRRAKGAELATSPSAVLRPRPAEPSKKQQREHARKLRAL